MLWPTFLLLASFIATALFIGLALSRSRRHLWPAVLTSWLGSFLGSWSIGLLTLVVTFVLLAIAIADSRGWLTSSLRVGITVAVGVISWWVAINVIDDYWLFFPLGELLELFCG